MTNYYKKYLKYKNKYLKLKMLNLKGGADPDTVPKSDQNPDLVPDLVPDLAQEPEPADKIDYNGSFIKLLELKIKNNEESNNMIINNIKKLIFYDRSNYDGATTLNEMANYITELKNNLLFSNLEKLLNTFKTIHKYTGGLIDINYLLYDKIEYVIPNNIDMCDLSDIYSIYYIHDNNDEYKNSDDVFKYNTEYFNITKVNVIKILKKKIEDSCTQNSQHIYLYIELNTTFNYINTIKNMLITLQMKYYRNVTIINCLKNNNPDFLIPEIYFKVDNNKYYKFRKIINIIKNNQEININGYDSFKKIQPQPQQHKIEKLVDVFTKNNNEYYVYNYGVNIYKWLSEYIKINRKCFYKKMLQTSGTCWVNAVVNVMCLSPKISIDIKKKLDDSKITKINLLSYNSPFDVTIHSVFYHLLKLDLPIKIKKDLANIIGSNYKFNISHANINKTRYELGNGGSPNNFILYLFKDIYKFDVVQIVVNAITPKNTDIINEYTNTFIIIEYSIHEKKILNNSIKDFIKIYNYEMVGCLFLTYNHVICGFECDKKYYIFDSNSYYLELNWTTIESINTIMSDTYFMTYNNFDIITCTIIYKYNYDSDDFE